MQPRVFQPKLSVDEKRVWRRMGYSDPLKAPSRVRSAFDEIYPRAMALLKPKAAYRFLPLLEVDEQHQALQTPAVCFEGKDVVRMFAHVDQLVAWVLTVGPAVEADIQRRSFHNEDLLGAYYLDVIASEALMEMIRGLRQMLQTDLEQREVQGVVTRYWYCPGYGDWDVRQQRRLFAALQIEARAVGVRLNDHCAMIPRKSYSGLYGVGAALDRDPWNADIPWVAR